MNVSLFAHYVPTPTIPEVRSSNLRWDEEDAEGAGHMSALFDERSIGRLTATFENRIIWNAFGPMVAMFAATWCSIHVPFEERKVG